MATAQELMTLPIIEAIEAFSPQFAAALPENIPLRRFNRVIFTALSVNEDLVRCDRKTLFLACTRAAQDGLYPDGREAALVPYQGKVQYQPMIAGIRKRMMNSGKVVSARAEVVYENDFFEDERGDVPSIIHKPAPLGMERGEALGAYAVITLKNGEKLRDVMSRAEIEFIRDTFSKASRSDAPWKVHPMEMWRKTVLKRCSKQVPFDSEDQEWIQRTDYSSPDAIDADYSTVPMPEVAAPPRPTAEEVGPNGPKRPTRQRAQPANDVKPAPPPPEDTAKPESGGGPAANGEAGQHELEGRLPPDMEPMQTDEPDIILPGEEEPAPASPTMAATATSSSAETEADPMFIPFDGVASQNWYKIARAKIEGMVRAKAPGADFRRFAEANKAALATLKGPGPNAFRSLWAILDKPLEWGKAQP